jgi:hypothetical protein
MNIGTSVAGAHRMHKETAVHLESGLYLTKKVRSFKPLLPRHLVYTRSGRATTDQES